MPIEAAVHILRSRFPFQGVRESSYMELPSYDDRHYYFEGQLTSEEPRADGTREGFVLRIGNLMFPAGLVDGANALMLHLWSRGINCSRPVLSRLGGYMEMVPGKEISLADSYPQHFPVRVLTFVPGTLMSELDVVDLTPKFLHSVGNFAGNVDAALQVSFIIC